MNNSRITVSLNNAKTQIVMALKANLVPMLHGSPAIGKSAVITQIAKEFNLKVIDLRLAQCDPTDLSGFPWFDPVTGKGTYVPMDTFPTEECEVPKGYSGWLIFLDEISSAPQAVQAASYKLTLDRMVGNKPLHQKVALAAAGNLETDGAIVETMSTALQSRLVHLTTTVDATEWIEWAMQNEIDHRITSFIKFKPNMIYTFKPDHTDLTYAAPRTWKFTDQLIKAGASTDREYLPIFSGTLSEGVAREFLAFCGIYKEMLSIDQILAKSSTVDVPREPSVLYALSGSLAVNATKDNIEKLMQFISRMPIEFQVVTLRELVRRSRDLLSSAPIQEWVSTNSKELY